MLATAGERARSRLCHISKRLKVMNRTGRELMPVERVNDNDKNKKVVVEGKRKEKRGWRGIYQWNSIGCGR